MRKPFSIAIIGVALALLTACQQDVNVDNTVTNTHLPGFDIWLPRGVPIRSGKHPAGGSHEMKVVSGFIDMLPPVAARLLPQGPSTIKISWQAELTTAADLQNMRTILDDTMSSTIGAKGKTKNLSDSSWISTYQLPNGKVVIGFRRCDPWLSINVVVGLARSRGDADVVAAKIMDSVRCRLATKEMPTLRVGLVLPEHYGIAAGTDVPTYFSASGPVLTTNVTNGDITRNKPLMGKVLKNLLIATIDADEDMTVTTKEISRADGVSSTLNEFVGDFGDIGDTIFIGTLFCNELDLTALLFIHSGTGPDTTPEDLLRGMYCPGDPSGEYVVRPVSEVFGYACEKGNSQACTQLADLIDGNSATSERGSSADFRARACVLGSQEQCRQSAPTVGEVIGVIK